MNIMNQFVKFLFITTLFSHQYMLTKPITIMLDPAGDAKHTGRQLEDSFERGITLQCAEQLKRVLEEQYPNIRVVLTRFPGETLQPLQNANFANRLQVDFYVSLQFYQEKGIKPQLHVYQFSYGDDFITRTFDVAFYRYDQAYLQHNTATTNFAQQILNALQQKKYTKYFEVKGLFKLPFKPLIGIKAPAVAIEASLKTKQDWHQYIEPIVLGLGTVIEHISS